jgi:hypothetical protein
MEESGGTPFILSGTVSIGVRIILFLEIALLASPKVPAPSRTLSQDVVPHLSFNPICSVVVNAVIIFQDANNPCVHLVPAHVAFCVRNPLLGRVPSGSEGFMTPLMS